jgi:hypothetical protein
MTTPLLDAEGKEVVLPADFEVDEVMRLFFASRVPAPNCPHYMNKRDRDAGFGNCEPCGGLR